MQLSINIRNWGAQSTPDTLLECARAADESGLDTLWLNEHLAIPPQADMPDRVPQGFAEGRFLDPMATLSFLAAATRRIGLGTAVLLPALPPAAANGQAGSKPSRSCPAAVCDSASAPAG